MFRKNTTMKTKLALTLAGFGLLWLTPMQTTAQEHPDHPQATEKQPAENLPSGESILKKSIKASGGAKTLKKHKWMTITGTFSVPSQGMTGDLTIYRAAPSMLLMHMEIAGIGEVKQGYNGKVGWAVDPMRGAMTVEGKQLEDVQREADFFAALNYKKHFKEIETVQITDFNEIECYEIKFTTPMDQVMTQYYAVDTSHLIGMTNKTETPMGPIDMVTTFSDYKKYGGMTVPTKTTTATMGIKQILTFTNVTFEKIDPSIFDLPAQVEALVEAEEDEEAEEETEEGENKDG